ncbi:MAG: serine/threonine-protein kinase, partial [Byssovorax sp.]
RLERLIGRGGMGSVWAARHLQLDTLIAIKFIDAVTDIGDARVRFEREARAAAQLRSPHVVQILDHGIDDERPYIAMELLEGEDLGERLRRTPRLSLQATATIITQASKALRRAHEGGVIHRDLKPGNIFLARFDDDEVVKLLDFGVAKLRYSDDLAPGVQMTQTGVIFGSPSYMSPEQARGNRVIDHRTDLWSLAVILFRCITGSKPFEAESIGDLVIKLCIDPLPVPTHLVPELPPEVDSFFERAFARDPDLRFQSATALAQEFEAIAARAAAPAPVAVPAPSPSFRGLPPPPPASPMSFTPPPAPRGSNPRFDVPPPPTPPPPRAVVTPLPSSAMATPLPSSTSSAPSSSSGSYAAPSAPSAPSSSSGSYALPPSAPSRPDFREVAPPSPSYSFGAATGGYGAPPAEPAPQPASMTPSPALMAVSAFAAALPLRSRLIAAASVGGGMLLLLAILIGVAVSRRAPDAPASGVEGEDLAAMPASSLAPILPPPVASAAPEPAASAAPEPAASAAPEPAASVGEPDPDPSASAGPATSASGRKPVPGKQGRGRTPNFGY